MALHGQQEADNVLGPSNIFPKEGHALALAFWRLRATHFDNWPRVWNLGKGGRFSVGGDVFISVAHHTEVVQWCMGTQWLMVFLIDFLKCRRTWLTKLETK